MKTNIPLAFENLEFKNSLRATDKTPAKPRHKEPEEQNGKAPQSQRTHGEVHKPKPTATASTTTDPSALKPKVKTAKTITMDSKAPKVETTFSQIYKNFIKPQRASKSPVPAPRAHDGDRRTVEYFARSNSLKGDQLDKPITTGSVKTPKARRGQVEEIQTAYSFQRFCDKKDKFLYLLEDSDTKLTYDDTDVFEFLLCLNSFYQANPKTE